MKPSHLEINNCHTQAILNAKFDALNIQYQLDCTDAYIQDQNIVIEHLQKEFDSYLDTV